MKQETKRVILSEIGHDRLVIMSWSLGIILTVLALMGPGKVLGSIFE